MECLYCHNKISSFKFWKSAKFCSKEHEEAYRSQTLDRLIGETPASSEERPPLPLPQVTQEATERETTQLDTAKSANARDRARPGRTASAGIALDSDPHSPLITPPHKAPTVEEILASAGKPAVSLDDEIASWEVPPAPSSETDVSQQSAEEALEALRNLARAGEATAGRQENVAEQVPHWEETVVHDSALEAAGDQDLDDPLAELRRLAAMADDAEGEPAAEHFDASVPIPHPSALDRLTEIPAPGPPQSLFGPLSANADEHATATADSQTRPEPSQAEETAHVEAELGEPASALAEDRPMGTVGDKVVSFPGEDDPRRKNSAAHANAPAANDFSLFDPEIHDEFMAINLGIGLNDDDGFVRTSADQGLLDGKLKGPAGGLGQVAECNSDLAVRTPEGFGFRAAWMDCLALRDSGKGSSRGAATDPDLADVSLALPLGLLESVGVVPARSTERLVRSRLFHKEPEVREFPLTGKGEQSSQTEDARRTYYKQHGTA